MKTEGPSLESLIHRITETPEDFLAEPMIGSNGRIVVSAVVHDLLEKIGATTDGHRLATLAESDSRLDRNRLAVILLLCWLLADDWVSQLKPDRESILSLLDETAAQLATQSASKKFLNDPDRREELARTALARLDCRPAGESIAQAQDRLMSLSSVERERVLRASREAEQRSRAIRAALAKKAADESADKWTRE